MHARTRKLRLIVLSVFAVLLSVATVNAQDPPKVCISQEAANQCAANTRENIALKEKIAVLENALLEKDKTIAELKLANVENVRDLTARLSAVTAEVALEKGRREQLEADKVFWTEIIKIAIANTRQKTNGIKIF